MWSPGSISGVSPTALPISGVRRFPTGRGQQGRVEWIVPGDLFALAQWAGQSLPSARSLMMQGNLDRGGEGGGGSSVLWAKRFLSSQGYEIEAGGVIFRHDYCRMEEVGDFQG